MAFVQKAGKKIRIDGKVLDVKIDSIGFIKIQLINVSSSVLYKHNLFFCNFLRENYSREKEKANIITLLC